MKWTDIEIWNYRMQEATSAEPKVNFDSVETGDDCTNLEELD